MANLRWSAPLVLALVACQAQGGEPLAPGGEGLERAPLPREGSGRRLVNEARPAPRAAAAAGVQARGVSIASGLVGSAGGFASDDPQLDSVEPALESDALPLEPAAVAGASAEPAVIDEALQPSSFESFKESVRHVAPDGDEYFVVEWDLLIGTESELRAYYDAMVAGEQDKGVVFLRPGTTEDDKWQGFDKVRLRYCVDTHATTGFAHASSQVTPATIIAAMEEATRAWERVANVRFQYDPSRNNNCGPTSPVPDNNYFKVARNESLPTVIAFTASGQTDGGQDGRSLGVRSDYITSLAPPGFTWPGTMMHELGHVLGLAHEHNHTNGGDCTPSFAARNITGEVDLLSIMGYPMGSPGAPACALTTPNLTALSAGDGYSARQLYGPPPSWHVAYAEPMLE